MSSRHTETKRILAVAKRQAKATTTSAAAACGTQAAGPINAGTMQDGKWVPYGRLGITTFGQGFRLRGD